MWDKISTMFNSFITVQNKKSIMWDKTSTIYNYCIIVQNKKLAMWDKTSTNFNSFITVPNKKSTMWYKILTICNYCIIVYSTLFFTLQGSRHDFIFSCLAHHSILKVTHCALAPRKKIKSCLEVLFSLQSYKYGSVDFVNQ